MDHHPVAAPRATRAVTARLDADLVADIDQFADRHGIEERSTAIKALVSFGLRKEREVMRDMVGHYENSRTRGRA